VFAEKRTPIVPGPIRERFIMAALFKPTRPYPLPLNAEIVDRETDDNGKKPHIRLRERGKTVFYPLSEDGKSYLKPAAKWAADGRWPA
jgi:hypothetical protein